MPANTPLTELDQLAELIAAQTNGVGIDAILQSQSNPSTRRTLQRRLALLVKQGRYRSFATTFVRCPLSTCRNRPTWTQ